MSETGVFVFPDGSRYGTGAWQWEQCSPCLIVLAPAQRANTLLTEE